MNFILLQVIIIDDFNTVINSLPQTRGIGKGFKIEKIWKIAINK